MFSPYSKENLERFNKIKRNLKLFYFLNSEALIKTMFFSNRRILKSKNMREIRIDSDMIDDYCIYAPI